MTSAKGGAPDGNQNAVIHGGAAGEKALRTAAPFTGPAALAEQQVIAELETAGRLSIVKRGAIRLQAVADLYFNALIEAGEANDIKKIHSYSKTFGWIQSKALSAWGQLKNESPNDDDLIIDAIQSARSNNEDTDTD